MDSTGGGGGAANVIAATATTTATSVSAPLEASKASIAGYSTHSIGQSANGGAATSTLTSTSTSTATAAKKAPAKMKVSDALFDDSDDDMFGDSTPIAKAPAKAALAEKKSAMFDNSEDGGVTFVSAPARKAAVATATPLIAGYSTRAISQWSTDDVVSWAKDNKLKFDFDLLAEYDVNGAMLMEMDNTMLEEDLEVTKKLIRLKIMQAIKKEISAESALTITTSPVLPATSDYGTGSSSSTSISSTSRYQFKRLLGKGSFGAVELVHDTKQNVDVAKKIGHSGTLAEANQNLMEAKVMLQIKHPNTVQFMDFYLDQDKYNQFQVNIIMEFCSGGDLQNQIKDQAEAPFSEPDVAHVLSSCLKGLDYIHQQKMIHRDIKPGNILLAKPGAIIDTTVKIADFGLAKDIEMKSMASQIMSMKSVSGKAGTEVFMAPEVYHGQKYKSNVDLWSLGIMMIYMMSLKKPTGVIDDVQKATRLLNTIKPLTYSSSLKEQCALMVELNILQRPTANNLLLRLTSGISLPPVDIVAALMCPHLQSDPVRTACDDSTDGCLHHLLQQLKDGNIGERTKTMISKCLRKAADQAVAMIAAVPPAEVSTISASFLKGLQAAIASVAAPGESSSKEQALHERLNSVKQVMLHFAHTVLRFCTRPMLVDETTVLEMLNKMVVEPAIQCMRDGIRKMQGDVRGDTAYYSLQLDKLSKHDKAIYSAEFSKRTTGSESNKLDFESMCNAITALSDQVSSSNPPPRQQPTGDPLKLMCLCVDVMPQFEAIVRSMLGDVERIKLVFRDETKALYRVGEKSILKGPSSKSNNGDGILLDDTSLDCSAVCDVVGCLVICQDFKCMKDVVDKFKEQVQSPKEEGADVYQLKSRWTVGSDGGWRDLMCMLAISEAGSSTAPIICEVQVVLDTMFNARKGMKGHQAYAKFRSFFEMLNFEGLLPTTTGQPPARATAAGVPHLFGQPSAPMFEDTNPLGTMANSLASIAGPKEAGRQVVPNGWEKRQQRNGRTYYVNHTMRTTHWELPESVSERVATDAAAAAAAATTGLAVPPSPNMQTLCDMGFTDMGRNALVLQHNDENIERAISDLTADNVSDGGDGGGGGSGGRMKIAQVVKREGVRIRSNIGLNSTVVGKCEPGDTMEIYEEKHHAERGDDFVRVRIKTLAVASGGAQLVGWTTWLYNSISYLNLLPATTSGGSSSAPAPATPPASAPATVRLLGGAHAKLCSACGYTEESIALFCIKCGEKFRLASVPLAVASGGGTVVKDISVKAGIDKCIGGAGIYKCMAQNGVAHRTEPNQTSTRNSQRNTKYGEIREAVAIVEGINGSGTAMQYLQWQSGGYSAFTHPSNSTTPLFTLIRAIGPGGGVVSTPALQKELCTAITRGSAIEVVRKLLEEGGADPSVPEPANPTWSPLYLAAMDGQLELVSLLLKHNADPYKAGKDGFFSKSTPLQKATKNGHTAVASWLQLYIRVQKQLCAAIEAGDIELVRKLLAEDGADPSVAGPEDPMRPPVYLASKGGQFEVVKILLEHSGDPNQVKTDNGVTPIYTAASNGRLDIAEVLLKHNADVNRAETDYGTTPLYAAAAATTILDSHTAVVHLLKQHSAVLSAADMQFMQNNLRAAIMKHSVDAVRKLLVNGASPSTPGSDDPGEPPLTLAAQEGNCDIVAVLLKHSADLNQGTTPRGSTPLLSAACKGHLRVVELLLRHNAIVNKAQTGDGPTPLYMAAQNGHRDVAELLLKNHADVNLADSDDGWTPLRAAQNTKRYAVANLLKQYGAV